ncbi:hypothetical protein BDZ94DRAFT_1237666 [Collybia nuda]|uniref:DUF6534 domain-containing protein n=1 Tax=Collybia nuda TaxID=64659 RepID=A0A9P5Y326_9AGAR|nr:hypothetical protein BDZ94DRAFT_1237666 [Collybia nuda]
MEPPTYDLLAAENIGFLIIGHAIGLVLFGAVILQGYTYYQTFSNDHLFLKSLTGVVLLMEIAHSFTITYMIYRYLVVLRGFTPNGPNSYELSTSIIPASIISTVVQGFFAFRIYRLSGTIYICAICWLLFLLRLVGTLALAAESFIDVPRVPNIVTIISEFQWLMGLVFIIGAVADVIITASLCYYLRQLTPCQQSTNLLIWAIRTGMVTSHLVWIIYVLYQMLNLRRELREKRVTEINAILQKDPTTETYESTIYNIDNV